MDSHQDQAKAIFLNAVELAAPAERLAYLDSACGGDGALRREVEELLRHHDRMGSFLQSGAVNGATGESEATTSAEDDWRPHLAPPTRAGALGRLGHYNVLEPVGRGAMGIVLKAFDDKLQRVVAIKLLAPALAGSGTARKRFVREARAAAAVRDDHVVSIYEVDESGPLPFLVMEFIAGLSLEQRLKLGGPLELKEILRIGLQIAEGLAAAHRHGLVHRDIKPGNILLENGVPRVKITDFGLARAVDDASLTQSGVITGTPSYMSPEQAQGETVDHRADLFSLGSVLYVMCTGRSPFRADGSMAILHRVCEDTPRPIKQLNPDIPGWLCNIIARLHAKDRAKRFDSTETVAKLLRQRLAHLQYPSVVPQPTRVQLKKVWPESSKSAPVTLIGPRKSRRRQFALAVAAVLLALVAGLSFTEAKGYTHLGATVIRIFSPDGTLVVETDDPGLKVTIEGDGGLVITGTGLEEIRLRPGSYKIHADRDGKKVPLNKELVSITKGAREIVKVRLELPAAALPAVEKGAFVLLPGPKERKFDTLAEAVQEASSGDTIEIRGNGPFILNPIVINQALVLRAGAGFQPRLHGNLEATAAGYTLISTTAPLVMEGLEIQLQVSDRDMGANGIMLKANGAPLFLANCRVAVSGRTTTVHAVATDNVMVYNCELLRQEVTGYTWQCLNWMMPSKGRLRLVNSVLTDTFTFSVNTEKIQDVSIEVSQSTLLSRSYPLGLVFRNLETLPDDERCIHVRLTKTIVDGRRADLAFKQWLVPPLPPEKAQKLFPRFVHWQESQVLHQASMSHTDRQGTPLPGYSKTATLAGWNKLWGLTETDTLVGWPKYVGGDVRSKLMTQWEKMTAQDFRLHRDSLGYRAGKDGKDLGADVDLVGPGKAYEVWKKTSEYKTWLKDTGQVK